MNVSGIAYCSVLSFRKKPIGIIVVSHNRRWGHVRFDLERVKIHEVPAQFVRSSMGSLTARIERKSVPRRVDLERIASKYHGDVRLSEPEVVTVPTVDDGGPSDGALDRLWREMVEASHGGEA